MSFDAMMPSWFAVYPEFDVGVGRDCVGDVEVFRSVVISLRNQILDVDNLLKHDGSGAWFEEYSRGVERVWLWLGDVSVKLSQLAGNIEEVVSYAVREDYRKEQTWGDVQRYIRPLTFGLDIKPVAAGVALRDYGLFKTREYPLQVPFLPPPPPLGFTVEGTRGGFADGVSQADTVGANTDVLRSASNIWHDMGQHYRHTLSIFEDATHAWVRECGVFAPANFTPLLESLRGFPRITDQHAENLAETARRFDETQEEAIGSFDWPGTRQTRLTSVRSEYIDPWGHGSEHRDRPILEAFFRGLKQGAKDTVSTVGGLLGVIWSDDIQPDLLDGPEKDLEDSVSAFIDDPLGTLSAAWDYIAQSFQTPEGAAEFAGSITGGLGVAGAAAKGIKIIGKALKSPEIPYVPWPDHIQKLTPDEAVDYAKGSQGTPPYIGIDDFTPIEIKPGDVYYRGEPNGSDFFTTKEAIDSVGAKQKELFKGLQVERHETYGYRPRMQGYRYVGDESFYGAQGKCLANKEIGAGGLEQRVIPNTQELIDAGLLVPVDEITLIPE